jgi:hypothetical protein
LSGRTVTRHVNRKEDPVTAVYGEASWRLVASDILEHWDADGHRILVYSSRSPDSGRGTASFAAP